MFIQFVSICKSASTNSHQEQTMKTVNSFTSNKLVQSEDSQNKLKKNDDCEVSEKAIVSTQSAHAEMISRSSR